MSYKNPVSGIYKIESRNNKVYIGSAVNIKRRWAEHIRNLNRNIHINKKLQHAWNKYGASYFTFTIIEIVKDKNKLLLQEQKYLNILFAYYTDKEHYNILPAAGSPLGSKIKRSESYILKKSKTCILLSSTNELVTITNIEKFCRTYGYKSSAFSMLLKGKRNTAYGYKRYELNSR